MEQLTGFYLKVRQSFMMKLWRKNSTIKIYDIIKREYNDKVFQTRLIVKQQFKINIYIYILVFETVYKNTVFSSFRNIRDCILSKF